MLRNKIASIGLVALTSLPFSVFASGLTINNETNQYGTGEIGTHCSDAVGSGIVAPHSSFTVAPFILTLFCGSECTATLYASKDCSGSPIVTLTLVDHEIAAANVNQPNNYAVSWTKESVTIKEKAGLFNWFKRLLG